ncbi:putative transposase [Variovorax paradoxus B4]|uniref:Putative transposase n=1 Tax=Variovorax paradoxus B4 TaxID=1246301 RepID=T1XAE5_VARPD|nr:putative transposase [Variovorax paradoxus B4]
MIDLIIEDATLIRLPAEGITKVHVRFKGGKTQTITTVNRRSSAQQVKTQPKVVELVDMLLEQHTHAEIAELLEPKLQLRGRHQFGNGHTKRRADTHQGHHAYVLHTALNTAHVRALDLTLEGEIFLRKPAHQPDASDGDAQRYERRIGRVLWGRVGHGRMVHVRVR